MLQIDKSKVDFLVTAGMVREFNEILERDLPKVRQIVATILQKGPIERVYFVACGSPLSAASTAKMLFDRFSARVPCAAYSGWNFVDAAPKKLDPTCLVVGISQYGKTEEVTQALELARARGAHTVAVTKQADNPITEVTNFVIDYHAESIWTAHLLITYAFAYEVICQQEGSSEMGEIYTQLSRLPPVLEKLVNGYEETGRQLGEIASRWPFIYTIAGGILTPLAYKEGIVTLLEFTWTHGSTLDSAEFRHGPLEVVEEGVPYLFLVGTDENRHTTLRALDFVKRYTHDVIVFDYADINEGLHPLLAPFVMFVPLEWFCFYLSLYKDHNPDDRRYYGGLVEY